MTLLVPGLLGPWPGSGVDAALAGLALPALSLLLSRSNLVAGLALEDEPGGMTFRAFGYPAPPGEEWPVAAMTYGTDTGAESPGWVMRADPVHLRADQDSAHLLEGDGFCLSRKEADALVEAINDELAGESVGIEAPHPERWYVVPESAPRLRSHPPSRVAGGDLRDLLPSGDDGARWRAILTTIQTVLHASPVNEGRQRRGERVVNSVWFWGGGVAVSPPPAAWDRVWSDDPLATALARRAGAAGEALVGDAREWLDRGPLDRRHLVVLDGGYRYARRLDVEGWRGRLESLEEEWFAPLVGAMGEGALAELGLMADAGGPRRATRRMLRRWWRRRHRFHTFVTAR